MRRVLRRVLLGIMILSAGLLGLPAPEAPAQPAAELESPSAMPGTGKEGPGAQHIGRFELVVVEGHPGSPFLLDTATGCLWHQVQHEETKRTVFVEVDVQNLHWNWGSGAQKVLADRIAKSNLTDEQKEKLQKAVQRTSCGLSGVVLTPDLRSAGKGE